MVCYLIFISSVYIHMYVYFIVQYLIFGSSSQIVGKTRSMLTTVAHIRGKKSQGVAEFPCWWQLVCAFGDVACAVSAI